MKTYSSYFYCLSVGIVFYLLTICSLSITIAAAADGTLSYTVVDVQFEGNRRIDTAALRAQLKKTSGAVTSAEISEDIKSLYKTGFFDQITASIVPASDTSGRSVLKFSMVEKPVVRKIFIRGNEEVKETDLADIFKLGSGRFLDKAKLESLTRNAVSYYQSRGFYDASFEYSIVPVAEEQVDVTFTVTEGKRYKIRRVKVRGLTKIDDDDLLEVVQTRRYKWYSSWLFGTGRLNAEMLENDKLLMRQYFLDHGLVDATVSEPTIEKKDDGLVISFDVNEGREYSISEISAAGDLIEDSIEQTIAETELKPGDTFNASKIREDVFKISDKFTDRGYAFANVTPHTDIDKENAQVKIRYDVSKGNLVTINRINISGNDKTYDNVIRRTLKVEEQSLYSSSKIKRSQQLLERLGYFEEVNISNEPTNNPDTLDLNVNVREASTGTFSIGAGYSSSDGVLFNSRLSENNMFGTGRSISINADVGTQRDNFVFSVDDPRVNDSYLSLGTSLLRSDREFSDFDRRLTGGSLDAGYPLEQVFGEWAKDMSVGLQYEYLDINIRNVDINDAAPLVIQSQGRSSSSGITPRIVRNTINNPLNPSSGSRQALSFEAAGPGGNERYYLVEFKNQYYQPLWKTSFGDFIFALRNTFGYGDTFDGDPFPLFKRFFPGGINSVRGFKNRTLGPKDEKGNEFGGSKEFVNNFEFIFPLVNSAGLKALVFYDIGQAFDDDENIEFSELREAYGYGIRWTSPLGPIRIEFGFPIDRESGEDSMVTLFSFGAPI